MLYRVYSESNASDEIKWKLSLVQKNVFYQIFPHGYCRSERTFQIASTTAGSQGRTCLWWWDAWPPPRSSSSFSNSPCGQKAVDFFWETGNKLSGTDQAKKGHFRGPRPRRRPTKCALWRRCGQQIYSLLANFLTCPRSRMLDGKNCINRSLMGLGKILHSGMGIFFNTVAATVAARSRALLVSLDWSCILLQHFSRP